MRVTIRDLARAAGVSCATVSYVLNDGPRTVRPETRDRVLDAMRRLDYHPSAVARALSSNRMDTIGVVAQLAGDSINHWFASLLQAVLKSSMQHHQNVTLFVGSHWTDIRKSMPTYRDGRCDGLLLLGPPNTDEMARALMNKGVPFVLVNDVCDHPLVSHVDVDNEASMETLVGNVIAAGHRRIALIGGELELSSARLRHRGYVRALSSAGICYDPRLVPPAHYDENAAYQMAHQVMALSKSVRPTAICCGNDPMAFGTIKALSELGYRVPADISVTGFDDVPTAALFVPPLTTVRQPFEDLGRLAVSTLIDHIENGSTHVRKEVFPGEVVMRATVAPPPSAACAHRMDGVLPAHEQDEPLGRL